MRELSLLESQCCDANVGYGIVVSCCYTQTSSRDDLCICWRLFQQWQVGCNMMESSNESHVVVQQMGFRSRRVHLLHYQMGLDDCIVLLHFTYHLSRKTNHLLMFASYGNIKIRR